MHPSLAIVLSPNCKKRLCDYDRRFTENWKPESLRQSLLRLANTHLHPNDAPVLFYILFVITANLQDLRGSFFYAGSSAIPPHPIESKPNFLFQPLLQAEAFPPSHPLRQILTKLVAIDEANTERWRQEFTFDWDLYFAILLVKITWFGCPLPLTDSLSVYHSRLQPPSPYIGLHASPIVLQFQFYALVAVRAGHPSHT